MSPDETDARERRRTYLALIGLFNAVWLIVAARRREREELRPFDLVLLGLATFRAGRLIAYDQVTEPLRAPFTRATPDETGSGMKVEAAGHGPRRAIGELLACPTCSGTWAAAALVYGLELAPGPTRLFLQIMAATGAAELLDAGVEALRWSGQVARAEAGARERKGDDEAAEADGRSI